MRRDKSLRIGVHHANGVVWGPVYRTRLIPGPAGELRQRVVVAPVQGSDLDRVHRVHRVFFDRASAGQRVNLRLDRLQVSRQRRDHQRMLGQRHAHSESQREDDAREARAPRAELDRAGCASQVVLLLPPPVAWVHLREQKPPLELIARDAALELSRELHSPRPEHVARAAVVVDVARLLHDERDAAEDDRLAVADRALVPDARREVEPVRAEVDLHSTDGGAARPGVEAREIDEAIVTYAPSRVFVSDDSNRRAPTRAPGRGWPVDYSGTRGAVPRKKGER
eukprot:29903-Pelagococcus_subviridis.AAC.5